MIKIFDTTLRDGEQSPGFSMNLNEKLMLAHQLELLGVDVIEAGFPNASPDDFEAVKKIAELCGKTEVCGLARCHDGDIEACIRALENAEKPRIHVFIATSEIHMKYKLKMEKDEVIRRAIKGVKMAKEFTDMVDFSPEDATRSDRDFLVEILSEVVKSGVDTVNIPDTVGYSMPEDYGDLIKFLIENVPAMRDVVVSTHCHDDLGMAVANSLAGVRNGASQIECTVNGIGERAGNAALEEIVMGMKTRSDLFPEGTNIDSKKILATSQMLAQITGNKVQANKAIVGKNAFAHEAGIHQHGLLANRLTYEIMKPEDVGYVESRLILGKHSGRNALKDRLVALGIEVSDEKLNEIFKEFKSLADKKKNVYDADLIMIATDDEIEHMYEFVDAEILSKKDKMAKASVRLKIKGEVKEFEAEGDGAIDALYSAIARGTGLKGQLMAYKVEALTPDKEALGVTNIEWRDEEGNVWYGDASDTDVVISSGKALVEVLNRMNVEENHKKSLHAVL